MHFHRAPGISDYHVNFALSGTVLPAIMLGLPAPARASAVQSEAASSDVTALCIAHLRHDVGTSSYTADAAGSSAETRLLLAGVGSQLHAFQLPSGECCCCSTVMPDATRLHGISWLQERSTESGRLQLLAAVHGARHAALLRLCGPALGGSSSSSSRDAVGCDSGTESSSRDNSGSSNCEDGNAGAGWQVQVVALLPRFQYWTMDAQLSWTDAGHSGGSNSSSLLLAVGLSNNSVQAFSIRLPGAAAGGCGLASGGDVQAEPCIVPLVRADCSELCLLYSMSLLHRKQGPPQQQREHQMQQRSHHDEPGQQQQQQEQERTSQSHPEQPPRAAEGSYWLAAAGTIFLDVLVWATPLAADSQLVPGSEAAREVPPLLRLQGHEGSIHRCPTPPQARPAPAPRLRITCSTDVLLLGQPPPHLHSNGFSPTNANAPGTHLSAWLQGAVVPLRPPAGLCQR